MTYLWQKAEWPSFNWSSSALLDTLVKTRFEQGRLLSLPSEFVHSFELSELRLPIYEDLKSSLLSLERIKGWQASLYPTGYAGIKKIRAGEFRLRELSYPSLPSLNIEAEMQKYLTWWQEPPVGLDPVLRSALAFLWFHLISPFEAGNFEVAAALCELSLQQNEASSSRFYDIAIQLEENKKDVLQRLDLVSRGSGDISAWLQLFLELHLGAVSSAFAIADKAQSANLFWKRHSHLDLNSRQRKALNLLLEEGGPMTNRHYVEICNTSRESAKRDLAELVTLGVLSWGSKKGRSIAYVLT